MNKVYVISLKSKTDRRKKIERRLNFQNCEFEFVDAVTPESDYVKKLGEGSDLKATRLGANSKCTVELEYSCFASHLLALKRIIDSGKSGVILEDDALLRNDFKSKLEIMIPEWEFKNIPLVMLYSEALFNESYPDGLHDIKNNWCATGYWCSCDYAKLAYSKFNIPFIKINGIRSSECITMTSEGKFILPQLVLEDPINISSLRDQETNVFLRKYHTMFSKSLDLSLYTHAETNTYKDLFSNYFKYLNGESPSFDVSDELDLDEKYFAHLINRNIIELFKLKEDNPEHFSMSMKRLKSKDSKEYGFFIEENFLKIKDVNVENLKFEGTLILDPENNCFIRSSPGPISYTDPPVYLIDPMTESLGNPSIIKKHLEFHKKYDYSNYTSEKSPEYRKILEWYFSLYQKKEKSLLKIDFSKLETNEKLFYFDLVLINAFKIDKDFGYEICKELEKICPDNLVDYFEKNVRWYTRNTQKKSILIIASSVLDYNPDSVKTGIFGSEEAVIYLSECLSKTYNVTIFNGAYTKNRFSLPTCNPKYTRETKSTDHYDIGILWRQYYDIKNICSKVYSWHHDICVPRNFTPEQNSTLDGMFLLSDWHVKNFQKRTKLNNPIICGNGIIPEHFTQNRNMENKYSFVYTSCYARGLVILLQMWPDIKKKYPTATLDLCYGWSLWNQPQHEQKFLKDTYEKTKHLDITDHGKVGHHELIKILKRSSTWAYPCIFEETFCITALKMQACGVVPVAINIAALEETIMEGYTCKTLDDFSPLVWEALEEIDNWTPERRQIMADKVLQKYSWEKVAQIWSSEFDRAFLKEENLNEEK